MALESTARAPKPGTVRWPVTSTFFAPKGQRSKALGNAQGQRDKTRMAARMLSTTDRWRACAYFRSRTRKSRWRDAGLDEAPGALSGQLSIAPCSIQSRMSPSSSGGSRSPNSGMVLPTGGASSLTFRYSRLFAGSIGTTSVSSGSFTLG